MTLTVTRQLFALVSQDSWIGVIVLIDSFDAFDALDSVHSFDSFYALGVFDSLDAFDSWIRCARRWIHLVPAFGFAVDSWV